MKKIDYKVPDGKFLRLQVDIYDNIIKDIKIAGDFFIHPEEAICDIENFLIGKRVQEIEKCLSDFFIINNIQIIGFSGKDLQEIIINSL